jgi:DNA-binding XRE family transcriptional regulator
MFLGRANAHQNLVCYTHITETFYHSQTISILKGTSDLSTVGGRIQYYRLLNGLYQEDVANRSGIDRTTIIRYENNQLVPSLELCNQIAATIGIDPYLIYDEYLTFIASNFGNKIELARKKYSLTQKQFGHSIGVHRKSIVRWEKQRAYPSRENYTLIKNYL